ETLSLIEEFEYRVRKGTAYYELKSYKDAMNYLEPAVAVLNDKKSFLELNAKNKGYPDDKVDGLGLWALETLADVYKITGEQIKISFNSSNIKIAEEQFELKAYYYVKAQDAYIEVLRQDDRDAASKGLYMIGELYERAYDELWNTPVPDDIIKQKLERMYKDNLKNILRSLLEKSKTAHKKNIEYAVTYKIENAWVEKSRVALERIKKRSS
ncbi:MAG: hypothetical protein V1647_02535, partial [Pseudomonadota bacterium]